MCVTLINGDSNQPLRKLISLLERANVLKHSDETFLQDFIRIIGVTKNGENPIEQLVYDLATEFLKCLGLSELTALY